MAALIPFTSNYTDVSTYEGYQFEFCCQRCGNGYRSTFRHSVTGFGGRIAALGGSLLGGEIGSKVEEVGLMAQWDRNGTRGTTNDKRLVEASQDVAGEFVQCRRCADWVCRGVCWDDAAGSCVRCVPSQPPSAPQPYASQPYAPQQYPAQLYAQPPTYAPQHYGQPQPYGQPQAPRGYAPPPAGGPRISLRHPGRHTGPAAGHCPSCGSQVSGRFCGGCGCPIAPPACSGCGAPSQGTAFCTSCGTPTR
jgi:hypothetical protein